MVYCACLRKRTSAMNHSEEVLNAPPSKKIQFAFIPLLTVPIIILFTVTNDRRLTLAIMAFCFAVLAIVAYRKKLHIVVRVAFVVGSVAAIAATWFYGFSGFR